MNKRFPKHKDGTDHADWLDLIDVSGPFLSVPVLRHIWPTLDTLDKPARERLRREHAALPGRPWIDYILGELLGWGDLLQTEGLDALAMDVPEHDTTVTPSFVLREPGAPADDGPKTVHVLGLICDDRPTQRVPGSGWAATPADRLAQLCRHHDVQLGLATDGRWFTLVWAPRGGVTTTASFDSVNWHEAAERDVVRAFLSILHRSRFFAVPDDETPVALLKASLDNQEDITEALGVQVRQAVELLVAAIGRAHAADVARGGPGIGDVPASEVYRASVAVMMRIVFLLFAEERGLLPSDKPLYRTAYSAGRLCAELEQRALDGSEDDLEHTYHGWNRLLALFNAIYYGVDHPDMPMHAHDGSIFDPSRFEWLPLNIEDRTVLHMLKTVQYVEIGTGKSRERRKLSFRALDVEQIGYVYEGLLSFEGLYAEDTVVGLIGKAGIEEEVPLSVLEGFAASCPDVPALASKLATEYKDSRIGSAKALEKRLAKLTGADEKEARRKLLAVTNGNAQLTERLLPFYGVIRTDLRDLPVVILQDGLYVTESSLRKNTGTHYTPKFLAEQVVEGALEPLVYEPGPLQTADKNEWKPKSSDEILSLKVADIAMGSAAFLVAACRYLAEHLVAAWLREGDERATGYEEQSTDQSIDADADPVVINARRHIIEHCLYGADINEMAVEMAKLSLWLVSMDPHRPFTFLDDRLIVGDSLLGITSLDQLEVMHMDAKRGRKLHEDDGALFDLTAGIRELVGRVADKRRKLVAIEGTDLDKLTTKREMLDEVEAEISRAWLLANLATATALANAKRGAAGLDAASNLALEAGLKVMSGKETDELEARGQLAQWLRIDLPDGGFSRRPIHFPLAFPEVFERGGFDAVIGNPPFLGGPKLRPSLGYAYRELLSVAVANNVRATNADLVAYFALRSHALVHARGQCGLIATNTLAQGDTREVGLDQIVNDGVVIRRAIKSESWPSRSAALEYCAVWSSKKALGDSAEVVADGVLVPKISSSLEAASRVAGPPKRLAANAGRIFIGHHVNGMGFVMEEEEAEALIERDPDSGKVIYPYLNGQDVSSRPDVSASRKIVQFHVMSEAEASMYSGAMARVRTLVKPEREKRNRESHRKYWWRYADYRRGMEAGIADLRRVCVLALVSKAVMPVLVPTGQVFSHRLAVLAADDTAMLAMLSSSPHYWWTLSRTSTLETRVSYAPSDVFETLPLPDLTQEMRELGQRLDSFRRDVMLARQAGITKTYNLVHDASCDDGDIVELREIHKAIDEAVCRSYGWHDLLPQLNHGHHNTGREMRYTVGPEIQRELVDRLLELNHERYAAEVAAGLHDKKAKKGRAKPAGEQGGLF
nr:DNA methyltransferase [Actinomadura rifamycini]